MKNRAIALASNPRLLRLAFPLAAVAVALGLFAGWLSGRGADPASRLAAARDLAFDHKPDDALKQVRRALAELGPDGDRGLRLQALTRAAQITDTQLAPSHAGEALAWYRDILTLFPGTPEAFDAGVRISEILHLRLGDDVHAEQQLVTVVNAFPRQTGVERLLLRAARSAEEGRRFDEAKAYAERLLRDYDHSELASEAQSLIGEILHLEGRHGEAVKAFAAVNERWPRTEAAARALFEEGNCLAETGDLSLAMGKFIEALPDHPDPMSVQRSLERVRRRFSALRNVEAGSKAYAFGAGRFEHAQ